MMNDYKPKAGERENDMPFENPYQLWMMVATWAFLPGIINPAISAGGDGWWFCLFVIGILTIYVFSEKFKRLFKDAKWFRVFIYINFLSQLALFILSMILSAELVYKICFGVSAALILFNYFNIETHIERNGIFNK